MDQLLRGQVFVDLYRVVRQGIRASVESYSIKRLEPLYGFKREIDLRDAGESIVEFEHWLEPGPDTDRGALLDQIKAYNRDDCVSTWYLREWLEEQRAALVSELGAEALLRPTVIEPEETEDSEEQQEIKELVDRLTDDLEKDLTDGTSARGSGPARALAAGAACRLAPPRAQGRVVALLPPEGRANGGRTRGGNGRARAAHLP